MGSKDPASSLCREVESEIPFADRKDEIGVMAAAVQVFRNNTLERLRLEREAESNRALSESERIERENQKMKEAGPAIRARPRFRRIRYRLVPRIQLQIQRGLRFGGR